MSADELDAELLAMAGSDSSDDEGDVTQQVDDRSPSPDAVKPSVEKKDEEGGLRRGVAQRVRAKRGAKKLRRRDDSEDEEEGEASGASSPRSLGSGAMAQSDYEGDAPASPAADEDAPLFPIENKYMSAEDKRHIDNLPEIEREEILADRAHQVIRRQQDLQLKRALASTRAKASSHKRKAAELEDDDAGNRKSSRPKAEKTGRSALDNYKKAREQRGAERTNRLDTRRDDRREERSPSVVSDLDAEGESEEVEWAEPTRASESRREEPAADLRDFERCRVGRSNFAKVCFYPNFENAVKGCFCRVSIGMNRETGQNMYRMAQIKGFTEGKPYQLESANGKHFTSDQYALVAHGPHEKPWPFLACSDSRFTPEEYDRYIATLKKENMRVPAQKYLQSKLNDIHALLNHNWTDDEIQAKINKQRAMQSKYDPANAANLAREKIKKRKIAAEEEGDEEELARCEAELTALEANAANGHSASKSSVPIKPKGENRVREQDRLAQLNKMNRRTNAEEVRKALIEEQRKRTQARERARAEYEAKRKAEEDAKIAATLKVPKDDLFGEGSDLSRAGTPANGTPMAKSPAKNGIKKEKGPLGAVRGKGKLEEEVIAGMDLGIDIEI